MLARTAMAVVAEVAVSLVQCHQLCLGSPKFGKAQWVFQNNNGRGQIFKSRIMNILVASFAEQVTERRMFQNLQNKSLDQDGYDVYVTKSTCVLQNKKSYIYISYIYYSNHTERIQIYIETSKHIFDITYLLN